MKLENNNIVLTGVPVTLPKLSHSKFGENFYIVQFHTLRKSGVEDTVPVQLSDRMIDLSIIDPDNAKLLRVEGQVRSFNKREDNGKTSLNVYVFAQDVSEYEGEEITEDENQLTLCGYLCKKPAYRKTPQGREISDMLLAVNRPYGKSDYLPCIVWGRNARFASSLEIGTEVVMEGRFQSRQYTKTRDNGTQVTKTAYEMSISRIELVGRGSN